MEDEALVRHLVFVDEHALDRDDLAALEPADVPAAHVRLGAGMRATLGL